MDTPGRGADGPQGLPLRGRPGLDQPAPAATPGNDRFVALMISLFVAAAVAVVTTLTFYWIRYLAVGEELAVEQAAAADLSAGGYYPGQPQEVDATGRVTQAGFGPPATIQQITQTPPNFSDPVRAWYGQEAWNYAQAQAGLYVAANPEPQNVQILTGMTTQQIWTYMQQHVSGALGVSCQYCHNLAQGPEGYANFAQEEGYEQYNKKVSSRLMMQLVTDLNRDWVANGALIGWKGNYVNCATCHNGQPNGMEAFPQNFYELIPIHNNTDYKEVVRDEIIFDYEVATEDRPIPGRENVPVGQGELSLTYEGGPTQDAVWLNQYAMYTMGWSLGAGCNYCHNSRNFVSYEKVQKTKAQRMLLMTTFLSNNWDQYGALPDADGQLVLPGCYTCHVGQGVPHAAMNTAFLTGLPADQQQIALPEPLRGLPE
jgi:photosynthetic reaction center cytochrome c subunit